MHSLAPDVALALKASLAICETLQQQIAILEQRLTECVKLRADYRAAEDGARHW
ncbi:hypothetical protein PQR34_42760 [Paraburkholderia sediminicola]|uniref:hypothetical protein n=1 Tax=Paraburkholderia sediminicola TaxID=458836 RepID=UPI0038B970EF